ncbi:MAG: hypothetical protein IJB94_05750 [Clostridia bacterium]|nr:hypothetical protein [Clostridia bacterium]
MNNLTPELIAKAKAAKNTEELLELVKENGVELTEDEAKTYFEQLNANGAVSDEELDAVVGGGSCPDNGEEEENTLSGGDRVKIPRCTGCGSTTGYVAMPTVMSGSLEVRCEKCKKIVGTTADANKFTKI